MARVFAGGIDEAEYLAWAERDAPYLVERNRVIAAASCNSQEWSDEQGDSPMTSQMGIDSPPFATEWFQVSQEPQQQVFPGMPVSGVGRARHRRDRPRSTGSAVDLSEVYSVPDTASKVRPMAYERVRPPVQTRKRRGVSSMGPDHQDEIRKWADFFVRDHPGAHGFQGARSLRPTNCSTFALSYRSHELMLDQPQQGWQDRPGRGAVAHRDSHLARLQVDGASGYLSGSQTDRPSRRAQIAVSALPPQHEARARGRSDDSANAVNERHDRSLHTLSAALSSSQQCVT